MDFQGRRVWITGASSGIGEALALAFHQAGAKLILSARREDELKRVQSACGGEPETLILPMDVTNAAELPEKTRLALSLFGGIDILVLNAGITQRSRTRETDESVYRRLMEVNFFAPEAMARALLPSMLAQKRGHIVVISSVAGKFGVPMRSGYSATKFALHGFFEALRAEEERNGVHVTMVCPGYIQTDISFSALRGDGRKHAKMDSELAHGMPADECARQILQGIGRKKKEIVVAGVREKSLVYVKRFFPTLLARMIGRRG
ncbi:MAG TPA: SDR family oxidoreductase [Candidatus Polarisedimenticolia bacterium]|jgi:short-subunit dehydrogenase|nr:SDR family oxidoreductase [Candidatus Polarisedimenticolia bacterium]